jgi:hypothetical protein
MKKFYTYIYFDPRDNTPIYVGKGYGDRAFSHIKQSNIRNNRRLSFLLAKRVAEGYSVTPHITYHADEETALGIEKFWIMYFGRADIGTGPLFNLTDGGDGVSGAVRSDKTKAKMALAKKGTIPWNKGKFFSRKKGRIAWNKGKKMKPISDDTRENMSAAQKGRTRKPHDVETKEKISATLSGRTLSVAHKVNISLARTGKHYGKHN